MDCATRVLLARHAAAQANWQQEARALRVASKVADEGSTHRRTLRDERDTGGLGPVKPEHALDEVSERLRACKGAWERGGSGKVQGWRRAAR